MSDFIFIPLGIILWALAVIVVCLALTVIVDAVLALLGK